MKPFEQRLFDRTEERLLTGLGEARLADARGEGGELGMEGVRSLSEAVTGGP
jgi:hypothetical protein